MDHQAIYFNYCSELLNSTISLLERGEKEIELKHEYRNLVLVLGDQANDISLIRGMTGYYENATTTEIRNSSDEFIYDNKQIGDFILKYLKGCPESATEATSNELYYGCSCFSDGKNTSVDIVTTYITNKVLRHADRIKMVFTINYSSIEKGTKRENFLKFLRHVSDSVKDIEKYRKGLAIIAVIDNKQNLKKESDPELVGNIKLIKDTADFLLDVRQDVTNKQKDPTISKQDKTFYENALQFIDTVLEKDGEYYIKIGIFRKPLELESISIINVPQKENNNIRKMLNEEMCYTEKLDNKFKLIISKNSAEDMDCLEEEINNTIWICVKKISTTLHEHFQNHIQKLLHKLESLATGKTVVEVDPMEAVSFSFKFKNDYYTITSFVGDMQNSFNVKELVKKIKEFLSALDICVSDIEIQSIERHGKYIDIFESVSLKEFRTKPWGDLFKDTAEYISESRRMIENAIDTAVEKIKYRIKLNLVYIANRMQRNYNEKWNSKFTVKSMEIQKLRDTFTREYENIAKLIEDIKRLRTIDSLVRKLQLNSNIPGIAASKKYIDNISKEGKYFMFLHFLSEKILDNGSSTWSKEFKIVANSVNDSRKWYGFLSDLYLKFSEYGLQIERKYYADFLHNNKGSDIFQETNITPINFEIFLRKIRNLNVAEYESIKNISLTDARLSELNQIVNLTLKHNLTIECSDTHILVKGDYVSLQEVDQILLTQSEKKCKEFRYYGSERKFVSIFALNTLFIDRDIQLEGSKIQLIYISPRWEIIGNRFINLNGLSVKNRYRKKASDGYNPGSNGKHGEPGEPGGPGGIFFGIGGTFENGANLTVTAHGGDGGAGQDGGNGGNGLPGQDAELPAEEIGSNQCCYPKTSLDSYEYEVATRIADVSTATIFKDSFLLWEALARLETLQNVTEETRNGFGCGKTAPDEILRGVFSREYYSLYGKPGKTGGSGGDGGKGGIGGNPGSVRIVEMENSSEINTHALKGKDGEQGEGGMGGFGGKDGHDIYAYCLKVVDTVKWVHEDHVLNDRFGLSGRNGINGGNEENNENPEPPILIQEAAKIINKYKIYLREGLTDDLKKIHLMEFYEQMNKNQAVRSIYDLKGLVNEFIDLEGQHYLLKKVDTYPFYKYLLGRIRECSENFYDTKDGKTVRSYLYAAILSKINSLKETNDSDLIIDIEKYFDIIKTEINILQDQQNKNSKGRAVDKMKKEYKKRIDEKIEEAKYFIENTVDPEINRINRGIDNKIDLLITETISLQKQTQKEKKDLEKKKEELKKALELKKVLNFFKVLGRVISFLGPYGMAIGAAIELGTSVGESFALGNNIKPLDLSNTAAKLNALENNIRRIRIEKTEYILTTSCKNYPKVQKNILKSLVVYQAK